MVVKDKNVLVFGSGISGEAACELLLKEEAKVVLYDGNDKLNPEEIRAKIEGGRPMPPGHWIVCTKNGVRY